MGNGGSTIKDHDPPTGAVINTAAAVDVAAGGLLLVFSDLIHNIIGVVLIAFGLYLFYYVRTHKVAPHGDAGGDSGVDSAPRDETPSETPG